MQPGDKFITYSRQNKKAIVGIVKETWTETAYDLTHWVKFEKRYIKSTTGITYSESECYRVVGTIPPKILARLVSLFSKKKQH